MPRLLWRIFSGARRVPAALPPRPRPALPSLAQTAARNYARLHGAAMARERRAIDHR